MGFFNSGGLVTRGYGDDHRIVTRGMGIRFDFGGIRRLRRETKKYSLNILAPVLRENSWAIRIYSPLEIRRESETSIKLSVSKEVIESIDLIAGIDHSRLSEILDAI